MAESNQAIGDGVPSLSLVLYGDRDAADIGRAIHEAEQTLAGMGGDYEILVIHGSKADEAGQAVEEAVRRNPRVRRFESPWSESYAEAVRLGLTAARFPRIALTNGNVDFAALRYLVPLALQHPIVWSHRLHQHEAPGRQLLMWGGNVLARVVLRTGVRDCGGGAVMSVFQRDALARLVPDAEGPFARAEVLGRARGLGLTVAEVPVSCPAAAARFSWPGWRTLFALWAAGLCSWWKFQFPGTHPTPPRKASWLLGLLLAALAALMLGPDNQPLLEPDEARQAEIPREMLAHADFLVPHIHGLPYYEKPPLQYWLTAAAYAVCGVRPWVARLIPAAAAWVTIMVVYAWGRRHLGSRPAFLGALALCLSIGFVTLGRTVVLDSLLAACVVAAWCGAHEAVARPVFRWRWWLMAALVCGLGVLAKGPVALVLAFPPVLMFCFLTPAAARPPWRAWLAFVAVALAVPAPWYAAVALRDPSYIVHFFWKANVLRFIRPYDHEQSWWFYLPVLFVATFPWSLLWPALAYFLVSKKPRLAALRPAALGYCLLLAGWCTLFYSLSGCKSPPYVVPALAPLSLMVGACLEAVIFGRAAQHDPYLRPARQLLPWNTTIALLVLSSLAYVAAAVLSWQPWWLALVLAMGALALAFVWRRYGRGVRPVLAWGTCAVACLGFLLFPIRDLATGYAAQHSPETLVRMIRHWPNSHQSPVVSFQRQWLSASFYLRREVVAYYQGAFVEEVVLPLLRDQSEVLVFVENGEPLEEFLKDVPATLSTEVLIPDQDSTVALVVVRRKQEGESEEGE
jgi:dolichol-phosphate mannosyltransferase